MKQKIRYGNVTIEYDIIKSKRRKTSEIRVDEHGVMVRTPMTKTNLEIKKMVDDKKKWIYKKQLEFADRIKTQRIRKTQTISKKRLIERVWELAERIGVKPSQIIIKDLKDRWGSSAKDGTISLNAALLKAPPKVIDYIIIHELCHSIIRDHSRRYWSLVRKHMPDYQNSRMWLDVYRPALRV